MCTYTQPTTDEYCLQHNRISFSMLVLICLHNVGTSVTRCITNITVFFMLRGSCQQGIAAYVKRNILERQQHAAADAHPAM